jgi:hypothetical protein
MAFCQKGKCKFTLTSPSGLPQCSICKRVSVTAGVKKKSSAKKKPTSQSSTGYSPFGGHMRSRYTRSKGTKW